MEDHHNSLIYPNINQKLRFLISSPIIFFQIFIFWTIFFSTILNAQQLPFAHLSIADGLEDTVVFSLEQDELGFLWIATRTGINRFDGERFWTYNQSNGLPHNLARALLKTADGTLWVAGERGAAWFDGSKFHALENWPENTSARAVSQAQDGTLWFATYGAGLIQVEIGEHPKIIKQIDYNSGLPSDRIRSVMVDDSGNIWASTTKHVVRISNNIIKKIPWHAKPSEIRAFYQHTDGSIWAGTRYGLARYNGESFEIFKLEIDLSKQTINTIIRDNLGNIWLGTRDFGVYKLDKNLKTTHLDMIDGLPDNSINSIYQDNENNMWFGTYGGGVSRLSTSKVLNWKSQSGMAYPNIYAIVDDHKGCMWFGTNGNGVSRLCNKVMTNFTRKQGLPHNKILSTLIDDKGTPWFGTLQGISHYVNQQFINYDQQNGLGGSVIYHMIQASDGIFWIGTNNGLSRFDGENFTRFSYKDGLPDNRINRILESKNGDLWIASSNGLTRYQNNTFTSWSTEDGLPANFINDFYEDKKGGIWIATSNGLSYFIDDKFTTWTTKDGLPHNNCSVILPGKDEEIWIGTSRGVAIFNGKDFTVITSREGLVFDLVNRGAGYRDLNGNLWFGTGEGASRFANDYKPGASNPPPIHLLSVSNNQNPLILSEKAQIRQQDSSLNISYSAISFQRSPDVNYRYRLDNGNNSSWRETRLRELQINSLAAGDYTFEVTARIGRGEWNTKIATYSFTVTPPFWRTTWFILLIIFSFVVAFILRSHRSRMHAEQLENTVRERTKQLEEVNKGLEWLANHDNLTKLANRNQVQEKLSKIQLSGSKSQLGIIVIDLDHFKSVNDQYGHAAGDKALQAFAGIFQNIIRGDQLACRWGGEEFIVICPQINTERLSALAEQILHHCRNLEVIFSENLTFGLRCSIGFALTPPLKKSKKPIIAWEKTIQLADMALYEAKHSGRDCAIGYLWGINKTDDWNFKKVLENINKSFTSNIIIKKEIK